MAATGDLLYGGGGDDVLYVDGWGNLFGSRGNDRLVGGRQSLLAAPAMTSL